MLHRDEVVNAAKQLPNEAQFPMRLRILADCLRGVCGVAALLRLLEPSVTRLLPLREDVDDLRPASGSELCVTDFLKGGSFPGSESSEREESDEKRELGSLRLIPIMDGCDDGRSLV